MGEVPVLFRMVGLITRSGFEGPILLRFVVPGVQIEWMGPVQVSRYKESEWQCRREDQCLPINGIPDISRVDGQIEIVQQPQLLDVFPQTVEIVVLWQSGNKLNELVFVYQNGALCIEEHVPGSFPGHFEVK